jgi:hypothetical protein
VSELGDIENAVVNLLSGIQVSQSNVFKSVVGFSTPDRRAAVKQLSRQRSPAALVAYAGRLRADSGESVVGLPKLAVFVASANYRGGDDPRDGDTASTGGFELLGLVAGVLDGVLVATDRRLLALDESVVSADDTRVIYEQRYVIDRVTELTPPTFDGVALAGASALVEVLVGEVASETTSFAFPGIDGVFRHHLGTRARPIRWRGQLRETDDAALSATELTIESSVNDPGSFTMVDSWSRTFSDCTLDRFVRTGPRRRHPLTGQALQAFELHFTQLNP